MKKILVAITFLLVVVLIVNASASGFTPTSLIFNLSPNEKACQTITIISDSETIIVEDKWAKNRDINWSTKLFNESASSHGITIIYPKTLSINERTVEVCVSGAYSGEYHGVMLMKEGQVGNSIIQMGVWVKLVINGTASEIIQTNTEQQTTSNTQTTTQPEQTETTQTETQSHTAQTSSAKLTGSTVGGGGSKLTSLVIYFVIGLLVVGVLVLVIKRRRKSKWERGL